MKKLFSVLAALFVLLSLAPPAQAAVGTTKIYFNSVDDLVQLGICGNYNLNGVHYITPSEVTLLQPGDAGYNADFPYRVVISSENQDGATYFDAALSGTYFGFKLADGATMTIKKKNQSASTFSTWGTTSSVNPNPSADGLTWYYTGMSSYADVHVEITGASAPDITPTLDVVRGTASDVAGQISDGSAVTIQNGKLVFKDAQQPITLWNANGQHTANIRGSSVRFASVSVDGTPVDVQTPANYPNSYFYQLPTLTDASVVTVTVTNDITVHLQTNATEISQLSFRNSAGSTISPVSADGAYDITFDATLQPITISPADGYQIDQVMDGMNNPVGTKLANGSYEVSGLTDDEYLGIYVSAASSSTDATVSVTFPNEQNAGLVEFYYGNGNRLTLSDTHTLTFPAGQQVTAMLSFSAPQGTTIDGSVISGDGTVDDSEKNYGTLYFNGLTDGSAISVTVTTPAAGWNIPVTFEGTGAEKAPEYVNFTKVSGDFTFDAATSSLTGVTSSTMMAVTLSTPASETDIYTLAGVTGTGVSVSAAGGQYLCRSFTEGATLTITVNKETPAPQPVGVACQLNVTNANSQKLTGMEDVVVILDKDGTRLHVENGVLDIPAEGQPLTIKAADPTDDGYAEVWQVYCPSATITEEGTAPNKIYTVSGLTNDTRNFQIDAKYFSNMEYGGWKVQAPTDLPDGMEMTDPAPYTYVKVTQSNDSICTTTATRYNFNKLFTPLTFTPTDEHFPILSVQYKYGSDFVNYGTKNADGSWTVPVDQEYSSGSKVYEYLYTYVQLGYVANPEPVIETLTVPVTFDEGDRLKLQVTDKDNNVLELTDENDLVFKADVQPLLFECVDNTKYEISSIAATPETVTVTPDATTGGYYVSGMEAGAAITLSITKKVVAGPVTVPVTVTGVPEGMTATALLNFNYASWNYPGPVYDEATNSLTFNTGDQPLTVTMDYSQSKDFKIESITTTVGKAEFKTTDYGTQRWELSELTAESVLTINIAQIERNWLDVPVTVTGYSDKALYISTQGSYDLQIKDGKLHIDGDEQPLSFSLQSDYKKLCTLDKVEVTGPGEATFVDDQYTPQWQVTGLTAESAITVTLAERTDIVWLTIPVKAEGGNIAAVEIKPNESYQGLPVKDGAITFDSADQPLTVSMVYSYMQTYNLKDVTVAGAGTVTKEEGWSGDEYKLSGLDATSSITVVLELNSEKTWWTLPLTVEGGPADVLQFIDDDWNYLVQDGNGGLLMASDALQPIEVKVNYLYDEDYSIDSVTVEGGKAVQEDGATSWKLSDLTADSKITVVLNSNVPVETFKVPVNVTVSDGAEASWLAVYSRTMEPLAVADGKVEYTAAQLPLTFMLGNDQSALTAEEKYTLVVTVNEGNPATVENGQNIEGDASTAWYTVDGINADTVIDVAITKASAVNAIFMGPDAGDVYNLQGIRVLRAGQKADKLAPGIYIMNGRKYILK